LAIAITRSCIRSGSRRRFYNVVDLVKRLETEARNARQGRAGQFLAAAFAGQKANAGAAGGQAAAQRSTIID
jgi:hypothetical protein